MKLSALFSTKLVKILKLKPFNDPQQLSLAPGLSPAKSGRACYDNPTGRGFFYQMSNMYTCIAYLTEIRKFCSKNLVHKGVNFEAQNALKLTYTSTFNKKISWGYTPGPSLKGGGEGKGRRGREQERGGPQFTFLATPLHKSAPFLLFNDE